MFHALALRAGVVIAVTFHEVHDTPDCETCAQGDTIELDAISRKSLSDRLRSITGLENPNSVQQLKSWLSQNGVETDDLGKKNVKRLIDETDGKVKEALTLRLSLAKSSVKKYTAMKNAVCSDGRVHGMFVFYGAGRTGRFTSKIVQLQNLPQNHMPDLAEARSLVKAGDYDSVSLLYDDIPDTLSQLIRTAFIPAPGKKFIVSDFSAIECRVLAWYAGEQWVLDTFANGGDIYCATAEKMFHVPVKKHGINGELRQKGKQATLSCIAMGQLILTDHGLKPIETVDLSDRVWDGEAWVSHEGVIDKGEREVITYEGLTATPDHLVYVEGQPWPVHFGIAATCRAHLTKTGNGRESVRLAYVKPRIGENRFGGESVTYMGIDAQKKWSRIESYGPKFVENIVQAVSRDILSYAMRTLSHCFICGHVHDELIIECSPEVSLDAICERMGRTPPWIPGIELRADGYECRFYQKQ